MAEHEQFVIKDMHKEKTFLYVVCILVFSRGSSVMLIFFFFELGVIFI